MANKTFADLGARGTPAGSDLFAVYPSGGPLKQLSLTNYEVRLKTLFLPVDGSIAMTGAFLAADGTANNPSISFNNSQTTGFYNVSSGVMGMSAGGIDQAHISQLGMDFVVAPKFTSTASQARSNLGVAIGTNVQAWSANLDAWSALATAAGSWTPTISFVTPGTSSISYAAQTGRYTRFGDMYYVDFDITFTPTLGTASGDLIIGGIPASIATSPAIAGTVSHMGTAFSWTAGSSLVIIYLNATHFTISTIPNNTHIGTSNCTNGASHVLRGSVWYKV